MKPPPPRFLVSASLGLLLALFGLSGFHAEEDPNDSFAYDRTESVLHLSLEAPGGTTLSAGGPMANVGVFVQRYSWQIWRQASTGNEAYRDASQTPESGASVTLSLSGNMGTLGNPTLTTNAEGLATTTYSPDGGAGGVYLHAAVESSTAALFFNVVSSTDGDEIFNYSHTEATLVAELSATGTTDQLYSGESRDLSLSVRYETWDVMTNSLGASRTENLTSAPAEGASVNWVSESGDASVSGNSIVDAAGLSQGTLMMGSGDSVIRAEISYATGQATSASLYFSAAPYAPPYEPPYEDPGSEWSFSRSETIRSINYLSADALTYLASYETCTLTGEVREEVWDVWVNGYSMEDWRYNYSGPAAWMSVSAVIESGDGNLGPAPLTTDGQGWFSLSYTMGTSSSSRVTVSTDSTMPSMNASSSRSADFSLSPGTSPTENNMTGAQTLTLLCNEGNYRLDGPHSNGPTYDIPAGTPRTVSGVLNWDSWEVWIDQYGSTTIQNPSSSPVSGATLSLSLQQGDGVLTETLITTDATGGFSTGFTMGTAASRVRVEVNDATTNPISAEIDFTPSAVAPETWTKIREESSLSVSLSTNTTGIPAPGQSVALRAQVISTTWEVHQNDVTGELRELNQEISPAIAGTVVFSQLSGPGSLVSTEATTDAGGFAEVSFVMGDAAASIRAAASFATASSQAEFVVSPQSWVFESSHEALDLALAVSGDPVSAITAMVLHRTWQVWGNTSTGLTEVRHQSLAPAENAAVQVTRLSGSTATFAPGTAFSDVAGVAATRYLSPGALTVTVTAGFAGLTKTETLAVPQGFGVVGTANQGGGTGGTGSNGPTPEWLSWRSLHFADLIGLDPDDTQADGTSDPDNDELTNLEEFLLGTDPRNPDSDGDDLLDGWEVAGLILHYDRSPIPIQATGPLPGEPGYTGLVYGPYLFSTSSTVYDADVTTEIGLTQTWIRTVENHDAIWGVSGSTQEYLDRTGFYDTDGILVFPNDGWCVNENEELVAVTVPNIPPAPTWTEIFNESLQMWVGTLTNDSAITTYWWVNTNPLDEDSDNDGMPDGWEYGNWLNPKKAADALGNPDNDVLSNLTEFQQSTNPWLKDTDGDTFSDGHEVTFSLTDPLDPADPGAAGGGTSPVGGPITTVTRYEAFRSRGSGHSSNPGDANSGHAGLLTLKGGARQVASLPLVLGNSLQPGNEALKKSPQPTTEDGLYLETRSVSLSYGPSGGDVLDQDGDGVEGGYWDDLLDPTTSALLPTWVSTGGGSSGPGNHNEPTEPTTYTGDASWRENGQISTTTSGTPASLNEAISFVGGTPIRSGTDWRLENASPVASGYSAAFTALEQRVEPEQAGRGSGELVEVRLVRKTAPNGTPLAVERDIKRTFLKVTKSRPEPYHEADPWTIHEVEVLQMEIHKGDSTSIVDKQTPVPDAVLKQEIRQGKMTVVSLLPVEVVPDVLAVNSDFDEGEVDENFHPVPDSENGTLKAVRDHLDGDWKVDDIVNEDLHEGFFGLRPGTLPFSETSGATVEIKKIDKIDPNTDRPESGHVRLYRVTGQTGSETVEKIELYDPETLDANDLGPQLYSQEPTEPVTYYLEGFAPGKITLNLSYKKGDVEFDYEQEFLVATEKSRNEWREEIRYQIRLLNEVANPGREADIANIDPSLGFRQTLPEKDNSWYIALMYYYYAQLFIENQEEFMWPGMARVAASSIYAGMGDMYLWNTNSVTGGEPGAVKFVNEFMIPGAQAIFNDLAWAHRAYAASGIWAIEYVDDTEGDEEDVVNYAAWVNLDKGIEDNDFSLIRAAGGALLDREQNEVIQPYYAAIGRVKFKPPGINHLGFWIGGVEVPRDADGKCEIGEWMSANSIENPMIGGPAFREIVPGGRLDDANDRWAWISDPAQGMLSIWDGTATTGIAYDPGDRLYLVTRQLRESALDYSQTAGVGLPSW